MPVRYPTKQLFGWSIEEVDAAHRHDPGACCAPPRSATATARRTSTATRPLTYAELLDRVRATARGYVAHSASQPGDRVVRLGARTASTGWSPALAVVVRRRRRSSRPTPLHRPRGGRHRRPHRRHASWSSPTASSAAPRSPTCGRPATSPSGPRGRRRSTTSTEVRPARRDVDRDEVEARADAVTPDDVADILFTSGTTGRAKGAMSAHRQTIGVARAWAELGGVTRRRPLPRGQPVLPLLRLQDRHRRRPAHRRDALPGRDLRPRRDDAR